MTTRGILRTSALVLSCVAGWSCGRGRGPAPPPGARRAVSARVPATVEIVHWWNPIGQSAPIAELAKAHQRLHPGDVVVDAAKADAIRARQNIRARIQAGDPPDVF